MAPFFQFFQSLLAPFLSGGFYFILGRVLGIPRHQGKKLSKEIIFEFGNMIVNTKGERIPKGFQIAIKIEAIAKDNNLKTVWFYEPIEILNGIWNYIDKIPGMEEKMRKQILVRIEAEIKNCKNDNNPEDFTPKPPLLPPSSSHEGLAKIIYLNRIDKMKGFRNRFSQLLVFAIIFIETIWILSIILPLKNNIIDFLILSFISILIIWLGWVIARYYKRCKRAARRREIEFAVRRRIFLDTMVSLAHSIFYSIRVKELTDSDKITIKSRSDVTNEIIIIRSPFILYDSWWASFVLTNLLAILYMFKFRKSLFKKGTRTILFIDALGYSIIKSGQPIQQFKDIEQITNLLLPESM